MKKHRVPFLLLTGLLLSSLLTGCADNNSESTTEATTQATTTEAVSNQEKTNTTEVDTTKTEQNSNDKIISTISMQESVPKQYKTIDDQIQSEVEAGNYTLKEPLVIVDPYQNSPLTAVAIFSTKKECAVRVTVKGKKKADNVVGEIEKAKNHRVPIIGLYAGTDNKVLIETLDDDGNTIQKTTLTVTTDPLPTTMEDMVTVYKSGKNTAYELTMVSGQATPHPFAYDSAGDVRWYLAMEKVNAGYGIFPLSDGRIIYQASKALIPTYEKPHTTEMYEMDYLGRIYEVYFVENGYHHEVIEKTPGGNLLVLTSSIDEHVEDVVQEIDRETGEIVKSLDMREVFGETYVDMIDWAHLNTASYIEGENTVVLSPRNIHSGIKVDWESNELKWILCNPEFWEGTDYEDKVLKPIGDIVWHYQPHSIYQLSEDLDGDPDTIHVMLYDNHWHKTRKVDFFDDLEYSYVSLYTINEKEMTVKQEHLYEGVKSKITSNFGFDYEAKRVFSMGGYLDPVVDDNNAMIYEYDYDTEKVINQYGLKYTFYRAYEMNINYNDCAAPMELDEDCMKGVLKEPQQVDTLTLPEDTLTEGISYTIIEDVLYLEAGDHTISSVSFIGENSCYQLDYSEVFPGEEKYYKLTYSIAIPLSNLGADTYQLAVNYKEKDYATGQTITIQ